MKRTADKKPTISDQTIIGKNNVVIALVSTMALIGMVGFSIYRYMDIGFFSRAELLAEIMLIFFFAGRIKPKYTVELCGKELRFTKRGWWGQGLYEVSCRDILGIYRYAPRLVNPVRFRRTYRLHSALDPRAVWTLAYRVEQTGKSANQRIYFKADSDFLRALNEKMPGKVSIEEAEVIKDVILSEKK